MSASEQALVEAVAQATYDEGAYCGNCDYEGWDTCDDCRGCNYGYAKASLAALRAALGPVTVLISDGLARVTRVGSLGIEAQPLVTLTMENQK